MWQTIESSLEALDFHATYGSPDVRKASTVLADGLQKMHESGYAATDIAVYLTGNSHIDVTWLWTLAETRFKMGRTTATALRMMEQYPYYRFAQSQAQLYDFLRIDYPDLFARVAEQISAGRWEIAGATWVEPDCNVSGGEALVRQILYAQKFWSEHFGREARTLWLPDTFGYSSALPQICSKSGLASFVTQKLTWNDVNPFPHGHFYWEGIDGSRIRCTFPQIYVTRTFPEDISRSYSRNPSRDNVPAVLFLYGYGDGGGGPVPEDIEIGARLETMPAFPRCTFSKAEDAIERINERADGVATTRNREIPVWRGELYLEFHRGTLTTHARMKRSNRRSERALREAEIWSSIAAARSGLEYPADDLESAWKKVLLNQFHDTVPGTSIPAVYPKAHALYEEVFDVAARCTAAAFDRLVEREVRDDTSFAVANCLSWPVTEWVEVTIPQSEKPLLIVDQDGSPIPCQVVRTAPGTRTLGFEATGPALGFSTYRLKTGKSDFPDLEAGSHFLDSPLFRVSFNKDGTLASVFDKTLGRELLEGPGNELQTFDDRPDHWEAWNLSESFEHSRLDLFELESMTVGERGPARASMRLVFVTRAGSRLEQDVVVYRTIPRIDFVTRIDWKEQRVLLKTAFPLAIHANRATYEIQFGSIERPTHRNTSWDAAKFEVCGHTWADLSEATAGVSLLNDSRYGHDAHDNVLRLTLLRNAAHPDPRCPTPSYLFPGQEDEVVFTDTGVHELRYALHPHAGDWRDSTVPQAHSLNSPLQVLGKTPEGLRPATVSDPAVVIETIKRAEDGRGLILRVYEAHGGRRPVTVNLPFSISEVTPVDLMERDAPEEGPVDRTASGGITFTILPYEIRSFRIAPGRG
jgi:alpha-mannosidase